MIRECSSVEVYNPTASPVVMLMRASECVYVCLEGGGGVINVLEIYVTLLPDTPLFKIFH